MEKDKPLKDEAIHRHIVRDGASELSDNVHVDQNTDFVHGQGAPTHMRSDSAEAGGNLVDNTVEKFAEDAVNPPVEGTGSDYDKVESKEVSEFPNDQANIDAERAVEQIDPEERE